VAFAVHLLVLKKANKNQLLANSRLAAQGRKPDNWQPHQLGSPTSLRSLRGALHL
jgi:hypothetical protein